MTDDLPTAAELDAALSDQDVTQTRVITLALMGGVVAMTVVAVVFAARQDALDSPAPRDSTVTDILSFVHLAVFAGCLVARRFVSRAILTARLPTRHVPVAATATPAQRAIQRVKGAHVTGLALLEGPAIFGLTVIIVAAAGNHLAAQPLYALNAFSTVVFLVLTALHFPNRQRLLDQLLDATA